MLTKNIARLRERADFHHEQDHFAMESGYGVGEITGGGAISFKGCALGCLAFPHTQREIDREIQADRLFWTYDGRSLQWAVGGRLRGRPPQYQRIAAEFGITTRLQWLVEGLFESHDTYTAADVVAAADFVRDFAHAIPDGVKINAADVDVFVRDNLGIDHFTDWGEVCNSFEEAEVQRDLENVKVKFFDWLRSFAPEKSLGTAKVEA